MKQLETREHDCAGLTYMLSELITMRKDMERFCCDTDANLSCFFFESAAVRTLVAVN